MLRKLHIAGKTMNYGILRLNNLILQHNKYKCYKIVTLELTNHICMIKYYYIEMEG